MNKYIIIGLIILVIGAFGGIVRFLNTSDPSKKFNWQELLKNILTGIGSAILIPLFLNMLSSDLIKKDEIDVLNYFVFAGFCFVAAYLSDRFILSIGERILREVDKVKQNQKHTKETVDLLIENDSEPDEESRKKIPDSLSKELHDLNSKIAHNNDDLVLEVLGTFGNGKYRFRTINGIAKELNYPKRTVETIIRVFESNGLIKQIKSGEEGNILWGITNIGKFMKENKSSTQQLANKS